MSIIIELNETETSIYLSIDGTKAVTQIAAELSLKYSYVREVIIRLQETGVVKKSPYGRNNIPLSINTDLSGKLKLNKRPSKNDPESFPTAEALGLVGSEKSVYEVLRCRGVLSKDGIRYNAKVPRGVIHDLLIRMQKSNLIYIADKDGSTNLYRLKHQ
jgi:hypothetical protein